MGSPVPVAASSLDLVGVRQAPIPGLMSQALELVKSIPEDKHTALLGYAEVGRDGRPNAVLAIMGKTKHGWSWVGKLEHGWGGDTKGSITLVKAW